MIAELVNELLNLLAIEHFDALTQEPPLTARAGQKLEDIYFAELPKNYQLVIITQDLPDRGRGALEKKLGTDLYVGIEVTMDGERSSKGFLVQAKWSAARSDKEEVRLEGQCRSMLDHSDHSYVWSYGPDGIVVTHAKDHLASDSAPTERDLADVFDEVLQCNEGDRALGLPVSSSRRQAIRDVLERLHAERGLGLYINHEPNSGGDWP